MLDLTSCFPCSSSALQVLLFVFSPGSSIVFICFSNALPREEYVNLACSITLCSDGDISSPLRYSNLPIFLDCNADIFADSLLISYCNLSSVVLLSIIMVRFCILSKTFFLKRKDLSNARVASITKN